MVDIAILTILTQLNLYNEGSIYNLSQILFKCPSLFAQPKTFLLAFLRYSILIPKLPRHVLFYLF